MNIDIGGGTTDYLYVNPNEKESIAFSAFFAANDLWNDGANKNNNVKQNGFISCYLASNEYDSLSSASKKEIEDVIEHSAHSEDVINYLFSHDDETKLSQAIQNSSELMQLLIIHFSSLIYYLAYTLDLSKVDIPSQISFTGMGSKYIHLISKNAETIAKLIKAIFNYYGNKFNNEEIEEASVKVSFAPEPKVVTAKGGLIVKGHSKPIMPEEICCHGYSGEKEGKKLRYKDILGKRKDILEFYDIFLDLLSSENFLDILADLEYSIDSEVISLLRKAKVASFDVMSDSSSENVADTVKLKEPMFFWPLKDALYIAGRQLAKQNS